KSAALAEKDAAFAEKNAALAEKDATFAEKNAALAEKDATLAEKNAALTRISELERTIELVQRPSISIAEEDTAFAEIIVPRYTPPLMPVDFERLCSMYDVLT